MEYSIETFDAAVDYILPNIKMAKQKGVHFNRLDLIKLVANKHFIESSKKGFETSTAYSVIQVAAKELEEKGYINFGNIKL